MDFDPRILVVTGDEAEGEALCRQLDSEGWTTITAPSPETAEVVLEDFPIEAAILVAGQADADVSAVAARLKGLASPRYLPVIALMGRAPTPEESTTVDLAMTAPAHPVQLRIRLEQLVRAALAEEELNLRIDTFRQQGQAIDGLRQLKHDILKRLILAAPMFLQILSQLLKLIQKFFSRPC